MAKIKANEALVKALQAWDIDKLVWYSRRLNRRSSR